MNPWLILAVVIGVGVLAALSYFEGKTNGRNEVVVENVQAIAARDKEMKDLKSEHAGVIQEFEKKAGQLRRIADEKIGKLLRENASLRAWWELVVPVDAADYAWRLRDETGASTVLR